MNFKLFSILLLIVFYSCKSENEEKLIVSKEKLSFNFKSLNLESEFLDKTEFLNGDKIPQAQSANEWRYFCKSKKPAWCYADLKKKKGVLYNYYVLMDNRMILSKKQQLKSHHVEKLNKELQNKNINLKSVESATVQRTFYGGNCDLNFFQTWIFNSKNGAKDKVLVMVWDLKNDDYRIDSVSMNNGFRIWALKK
jgi:hypothetical protein